MIAVRPFDPQEGAAWIALYRACLAHYQEPPASEQHEAWMLRELAAPFGTFSDIAWRGAEPVGFTCWMRVFPAGNSFAFYLKELFVIDNARGTGAGRALMRAMAQRAMAEQAQSVRWESGEVEALRFYDRLGMADDGKTHFTLQPDRFADFAA